MQQGHPKSQSKPKEEPSAVSSLLSTHEPPPGRMSPPIRVVLAEDHARLRALLRRSLAALPDFEIVGEAATGGEAVRLVKAVRPDVLLLDVQLAGDLDGVEVATQLKGCSTRILAFSGHSDSVHVASLLQAGAAGYLSKEAPVPRIAEAVRAVAAGESRWFEAAPFGPVALASDELAALHYLAAGGRPTTIRDVLGGSAEAAVDVLQRLYDSLDASSWYEAVARAWGLGLVGRVKKPRRPTTYSIRSNVPGQARAARFGSYGV